MGTRITYYQVYICPAAEGVDNSVIIPHVESGWCQVINSEFVGGGSHKRFLLHIASFEPVTENA